MNVQGLYTNEFLDTRRLLGDPEADEFIAQVFADPKDRAWLQQWISGQNRAGHLEGLTAAFPKVTFIHQATALPSWADSRLMKAGSAFFARHAEMIMSLLGLLSLPYCYTAANGAMVLYLSELIRNQTTKRLYDTAIFVWEVMAPDAFSAEGPGFAEVLKIRIMHAAVRYYTLKSNKWDHSWGTPINQEDMAGTNLSFSLIVIRGLSLLGFSVSPAERHAFMHLWAVIGHLSGLQDELIPQNIRMGQQLDQAIKKRQFRSSHHGRELTQSLINHILSVNKSRASANDIVGLMRCLLGEDISAMLHIDAPALPGYKLSLIRTINYFKGFKPDGNLRRAYHQGYAKFRKQSETFISTSK